MSASGSVSAAERSIYERILDQTRRGLLLDPAAGSLLRVGSASALETELQKFVAKVFDRPGWEEGVLRRDIGRALEQDPAFCAPQPHRRSLSLLPCTLLQDSIRTLAKREQRVRELGRTLQGIAASAEFPNAGGAQKHAELARRYQSIISVWQATAGHETAGGAAASSEVAIRTFPLPDTPQLREAFAALGKELARLALPDGAGGEDVTMLTAAVWRYRYGVRFVSGKRPEAQPPPIPSGTFLTDAQYRFFRWTGGEEHGADIEGRLLGLGQLLPKDTSPMLQRQEAAFFVFPETALHALQEEALRSGRIRGDGAELIGSIQVWAHLERRKDGTLTGDIGLQWDIPLEPVLPSLCQHDPGGQGEETAVDNTCVPILGGLYPPPPAEDLKGTCTDPWHRSSYLCRPVETSAGAAACRQEDDLQPGTIVLTACTDRGEETETLAGPDVCADIPWVAAEPFNSQTQCTVDLRCGKTPLSGFTSAKDKNGVIRVTIAEETEGPATYVMLHELTHARQACDLPPGTKPYDVNDRISPSDPEDVRREKTEACCRVEGEAYRVQCEAMARDGILQGADGREHMSSVNIPMNADTCSQILTDASCRNRGFGACPNTFSFDLDGDILSSFASELIQRATDRKPSEMPYRCSETLQPKPNAGMKQDPRVAGTLRAIARMGREVTVPGRLTRYRSTIGNTMCYLGQAIEHSLQEHRLTGGRQPFTIGDEIAPHDSCIRASPSVSRIVIPPTARLGSLPPYRPALLLKQLDTALCQSNGLPPLTPPVVCAFDARRRLLQPLSTLPHLSLNLLQQAGESGQATAALEGLSEALGARIGSTLFHDYLRERVSALGDSAALAADHLEEFTRASFPSTMCPIKQNGTCPSDSPAP